MCLSVCVSPVSLYTTPARYLYSWQKERNRYDCSHSFGTLLLCLELSVRKAGKEAEKIEKENPKEERKTEKNNQRSTPHWV